MHVVSYHSNKVTGLPLKQQQQIFYSFCFFWASPNDSAKFYSVNATYLLLLHVHVWICKINILTLKNTWRCNSIWKVLSCRFDRTLLYKAIFLCKKTQMHEQQTCWLTVFKICKYKKCTIVTHLFLCKLRSGKQLVTGPLHQKNVQLLFILLPCKILFNIVGFSQFKDIQWVNHT